MTFSHIAITINVDQMPKFAIARVPANSPTTFSGYLDHCRWKPSPPQGSPLLSLRLHAFFLANLCPFSAFSIFLFPARSSIARTARAIAALRLLLCGHRTCGANPAPPPRPHAAWHCLRPTSCPANLAEPLPSYNTNSRSLMAAMCVPSVRSKKI